MSVPGYVPSSNEKDLEKITRSIRNLFENAPSDEDITAALAAFISGLTEETSPATGDFAPLYDVSASANRKMTLANILKVINSLTEDTTPVAADDFLVSYDASAGAAKKVLLHNFPATTTVRGVGEIGTAAEMQARSSGAALFANPAALALFGLFKTGTYTGDGTTSKAVTGLGITPMALVIIAGVADAAASNIFFTTSTLVAADPQGLAYQAGTSTNLDNRILSLDSDGFTVSDDGTNAHPNANGVTYHYFAFG